MSVQPVDQIDAVDFITCQKLCRIHEDCLYVSFDFQAGGELSCKLYNVNPEYDAASCQIVGGFKTDDPEVCASPANDCSVRLHFKKVLKTIISKYICFRFSLKNFASWIQ